MSKTIVLSGGGTAGHIYPALAVAEYLQNDGWDVKFAGTPNGLEATLVPEAGIEFTAFEASGFDRSKPWTLITGSVRIAKSTKAARKWFERIAPACVVGFGGYVSIPVTRAAEEMGIPVVVHEQNSVMGMANKYVSKKASAIALTYPIDDGELPPEKTKVIGNPVRSKITSATYVDGRKYLDVPDNATLLLVFGGSRGAKHINEAITAMKDELLSIEDLHVVHITGAGDFDRTCQSLELTSAEEARYHVKKYENEMGLALAACDACVSRAGATSLAEIEARRIPAILIPYPFARGNHQALNARSYAEGGAAKIVDDDKIDSPEFRKFVIELASDSQLRKKMHEAACMLGDVDAAFALARIIEGVIE